MRGAVRKFTVSKEELGKLYWRERLSAKQIGNLHGVSGQSVHARMVEFGINRRTNSQAARNRPHRRLDVCIDCSKQLTAKNWWPCLQRAQYHICADCMNGRRISNETYMNGVHIWQREHARKNKIRVILHYSPEGKCVRCGFSDMRALSMDHIKGRGAQHIRKIHIPLYSWLIKNNFPEGFQVLCMNCQWIKRFENHEANQHYGSTYGS